MPSQQQGFGDAETGLLTSGNQRLISTADGRQDRGRSVQSLNLSMSAGMKSPSYRADFSRPNRVSSLDIDENEQYPTSSGLDARKLLEAFIYGVVNSILTIPCMYGYATIIFRDHMFKEDMAELSKLVLFSSVIHQIMFSLKSSLSFSIGQVQDAGLIFLSTMATSICKNASTPEAVVPTTLVTLSVATTLLGSAVLVIGKLRLAKLVSYLPMPVIGGYLAFIGFFCFEAGVGLSIGEEVSEVQHLTKIFTAHEGILHVTPAIIGGAILAIVAKKAESWLALPATIILIPAVFYIWLLVSGTSIKEAQNAGWLSKPADEASIPVFYDVWKLYDFSLVEWGLLPKQIVTWISMTFVVSFSSCLDVVAIEMDMGKELDINHELCTVGYSNIFSGLTGGYTGSYIFSQTIFTYRTKTNSRLVGFVVILAELGLFMSPFNVMEYVPLYFFASTLIFIAFDLVNEWIVEVNHRISTREYCVLLGTFLIILFTSDLIMGISLGVGAAALEFIFAYSSVTHVERSGKVHSNVVRDFEKRRVIASANAIARFDLHGFLFFGSSVQMVKKVKMVIQGNESTTSRALQHDKTSDWRKWLIPPFLLRQRAKSQTQPLLTQSSLGTQRSEYDSIGTDNKLQYIVFDFTRVTGMDSSAVSTGFMRLKQLATIHNLSVILCNMRPEFESLLLANHIIVPDDPNDSFKLFSDTNDALAWAEDEILLDNEAETGESQVTPETPNVPFSVTPNNAEMQISPLTSHQKSIIWLQRILVDFFDYGRESELNGASATKSRMSTQVTESSKTLAKYFGLIHLRQGEYLFKVGDTADRFFIVLVGEIALHCPRRNIDSLNRHKGAYWHAEDEIGDRLIQRAKYGSIVGDIHFILGTPRQFYCTATSDAIVFVLTREQFDKMQKENSSEALKLYDCLTKSVSLTVIDVDPY